MNVQRTFQFAEAFHAQRFSKLESLLDIGLLTHLPTAVTSQSEQIPALTATSVSLMPSGLPLRRTGAVSGRQIFRLLRLMGRQHEWYKPCRTEEAATGSVAPHFIIFNRFASGEAIIFKES